MSWKILRVSILLFIFVAVLGDMLLSKFRSTNWDNSLRVVIYPINGDQSDVSADYIASLKREQFADIEQFMKDEAKHYGITVEQPMDIDLSEPVLSQPPPPPVDRKNVPAVMWWSLQLRWWAYRHNNYSGASPDIRMFVLYHDPEQHRGLAHSLGLKEGLIGVVNAFAEESYRGSNQVVVMHEILHTLGATDKYTDNGEPAFPEGYADPDKQPLYPQEYAEIMAGRIANSKTQSKMAEGLYEVVVGNKTAAEINWIKSD